MVLEKLLITYIYQTYIHNKVKLQKLLAKKCSLKSRLKTFFFFELIIFIITCDFMCTLPLCIVNIFIKACLHFMPGSKYRLLTPFFNHTTLLGIMTSCPVIWTELPMWQSVTLVHPLQVVQCINKTCIRVFGMFKVRV